jgi:hypothetical protein
MKTKEAHRGMAVNLHAFLEYVVSSLSIAMEKVLSAVRMQVDLKTT